MAKDRLKRRIAEALAGPSVRDELCRILASDDRRRPPRRRRVALHPILDNVKDPILTVDPTASCRKPTPRRRGCSISPIEELARSRHRRASFPQLVPARPRSTRSPIAWPIRSSTSRRR